MGLYLAFRGELCFGGCCPWKQDLMSSTVEILTFIGALLLSTPAYVCTTIRVYTRSYAFAIFTIT